MCSSCAVLGRQALGDVISKQVELQASIKGGLMGAITPALAPVGTTVRPVIEAMSKPIYKAYRVAIRIFMAEMQKVGGGCVCGGCPLRMWEAGCCV
jgi:hypothetical protein